MGKNTIHVWCFLFFVIFLMVNCKLGEYMYTWIFGAGDFEKPKKRGTPFSTIFEWMEMVSSNHFPHVKSWNHPIETMVV